MVVVARAMRNLGRNPGKTFLLAAVLTVVVAVGIVGMAVEAGAQEGIQGVRRGLGNEVRLSANVGGMRGRFAGDIRRGTQFSLSDIPVVTEELAAVLASSRYVVETDLIQRGNAAGESIQPVDEGAGGLSGLFGGGSFAARRGFTLNGNALASKIQDFAEGRRALVEGRLYTLDEVTGRARVAVIDEVLAAGNNLQLGSTFTLKNNSSGELFEFEVIGICRDQELPDLDQQTGMAGIGRMIFGGANMMYVPYTAVQDVIGRPGEVSAASFYLEDPEHIEAFRAQAEAAGLDTEKYMLWSSDAQFDVMAGPLMKLAGFARTGVVAVVVAGALVICLLMTIVTRERKLEIGLMRALGATRRAVAAQLGFETLAVALIGLVLGIMIGGMVAQAVADQLLAREVAMVQNTQLGQGFMGRAGGGLSVFRMPFLSQAMGMPAEIQAILGPAELGTMAGISLLLALLGSLVAAFWSMKMHPASILAART
jgi:putative ABC transport system permease protein